MSEALAFFGSPAGNGLLAVLGFTMTLATATYRAWLPQIRVRVFRRSPFRIPDAVVMTWILRGGTTRSGEQYHLYEARLRIDLCNRARSTTNVSVADFSLSLEGKHRVGSKRLVMLRPPQDAEPVTLEPSGAELHRRQRVLTFSSGQLDGDIDNAIFYPVASEIFKGAIRFRVAMAASPTVALFSGHLLRTSIRVMHEGQDGTDV